MVFPVSRPWPTKRQPSPYPARACLAVEDEPLLAMGIIDEVDEHNGLVIGSAATLKEGTVLLYSQDLDAYMAKIHLRGVMVYDLADMLVARKIPFVFASTEHGSSVPPGFGHVPLHFQPIDMMLAAAEWLHDFPCE